MYTGLTRKLEVKNPGTDKLWLKLAEGEEIEEVEKGLFVIDQRYYISTEDVVGLKIRKQGGKTELITLYLRRGRCLKSFQILSLSITY